MHAIVVTGPPASGKSHLATHLAKALQVPLIARDAIKESLFDSLGYSDRAWSQKLGAASYDILFSQAESMFASHVPSLLLEANFTERAAKIIQSLASQYSVNFIQVFCHASSEVLWKRFQDRASSGERHPGHVDAENLEEARIRFFEIASKPLTLSGDLIEVETSDFASVDYPSLTDQLRSYLGNNA